MDVSYNGIDKNIFDNENVAELFGESLPYLYTFYYEGNYLPTSEIQNLVKHILSNNSLTYLYLQNNQIGDDSLEILAFLLSKNYNIHTLDLSYNKFTSKGVSKLCEGIMSKDTRLIEISLANNNLDETSLTYLADAITNSEQLYSVNLSYNNFSKGNCGMIIADMIKKDTKLKNVNLVACHLGLKTKEIFAALEENQTITFIDLSVNDIGNNLEMFKGLAKMLQKNKNIKYLYLDTNYITDRDFDIIINEGITKSVNLNYLSLKSNKITLSSIKRLSDSIKKDNRKLLEQYLKNLKKPKKDVNFFLRTSYQTDVLVRDYKYLEIIEAELQEKGILNSVKFNDHLKIIMLDDNPINDKESLIKLNTVLKFNGSNIPKNI